MRSQVRHLGVEMDELIALALAHGLDVSRIPVTEPPVRANGRRRPPASIRDLGLERPHSPLGELRRRTQCPAPHDTDSPPWLAVRFSVTGDRLAYWPLWRCLRYRAGRLAQEQRWPAQLRGRAPRDPRTRAPIPGTQGTLQFYLERLAQLVLEAERHREVFSAVPGLFAAFMSIEQPTWGELEPRYVALRRVYSDWLEAGLAEAREAIGGNGAALAASAVA